jgi:hypothetical protein
MHAGLVTSLVSRRLEKRNAETHQKMEKIDFEVVPLEVVPLETMEKVLDSEAKPTAVSAVTEL